MNRLLRGGAPAALALALTACAGTAPDAAEPSSTGGSTSAGSSAASSAASASASAAQQRIEVSYANGQVTGGGRIPAELGSTVTLQVTSDVADEVHVHGYDLRTDVSPGTPATVTVDATIPGVFEVELEELGQELLTLQVR